MVTEKEEMVTTKGVLKSSDDDNKSSEETEEGMVDAETAIATPDPEGNGTNEAINNNEGTNEDEGNLIKQVSNMCHQCHRGNKGRVVWCQRCTSRCYCVRCITKWYPDMTEEMFAERCPVCWDICNCKSCLPDVHPTVGSCNSSFVMQLISVLKSGNDNNESPKTAEECMVDAQTAFATSDREGNDTSEVINKQKDTKGKGRAKRSTRNGVINYADLFKYHEYKENIGEKRQRRSAQKEKMGQEEQNKRKDGPKPKYHAKNLIPDENPCIKDALDFVSPPNVDECIQLTEDFRILPHNHREKEDKLKAFSNLYEVPITEDLQISQNTKRGVGLQINPECEVGNEGRGGIIKRTRTSEEGDYIPQFNPETPNRGGSAVQGKGKESPSNSFSSLDDFVAELHAMRLTRDNEIEVMKNRLEFEQKLELIKEEWMSKRIHYMHLNTLLAKNHLLPEDENIKRHLLAKLYGK